MRSLKVTMGGKGMAEITHRGCVVKGKTTERGK